MLARSAAAQAPRPETVARRRPDGADGRPAARGTARRPPPTTRRRHSYRSAIVGSTEAACTAGPMPARMPTAAATTSARLTVATENTGETLSA